MKNWSKAEYGDCRWKVKLSPDEAAMAHFFKAEAQDHHPKRVTKPLGMYVCRYCGFIHVGHHRRNAYRNENWINKRS